MQNDMGKYIKVSPGDGESSRNFPYQVTIPLENTDGLGIGMNVHFEATGRILSSTNDQIEVGIDKVKFMGKTDMNGMKKEGMQEMGEADAGGDMRGKGMLSAFLKGIK